jgi:hypothetical integral membrane protein (TIGR02206 family)
MPAPAVDFQLFGAPHLVILTAIPASAGTLAIWMRRRKDLAPRIAVACGVVLAVNELGWYVYRIATEGWRFPEGLPLQLCDLALWLTVIAALRRNTSAFEAAYFLGLGGSTMALLTPDLWAPFLSYPTMYFFAAHGMVVATILALVWGRLLRPRPGCFGRVFLIVNLYAAAVGAFNAVFHTNYVYLCRKPANVSLLDYFGPWPLYIAVGELFAFGLFYLLWLPLRPGKSVGPAI